MIPTYFITIIYFITSLVGLFNIKKFTGSTSILFLVIISLGFFVELQGTLSQYVFQHNSRIGYNIYKFLSLVLYFIFFYKFLTDSFKKKLVYSIGIFFIFFHLFIIFLFINPFFNLI